MLFFSKLKEILENATTTVEQKIEAAITHLKADFVTETDSLKARILALESKASSIETPVVPTSTEAINSTETPEVSTPSVNTTN